MSKRSAEGALSGLVFAITGTLTVPRAQFESLIESNGGTCAKTVTNSCTHLISAETGTKKCQDAEAKGVTIVDEQWVRNRIAGGGGASSASSASATPPPPAKKAAASPAPPAADNDDDDSENESVDRSAGGSKPLAGMTIAITGTLSVPRAKFEKLITDNGGTVAKSVTNACTHLVSSETGTKKCQDAEAKGVTIVDEQWINNRISGGDRDDEMEDSSQHATIHYKDLPKGYCWDSEDEDCDESQLKDPETLTAADCGCPEAKFGDIINAGEYRSTNAFIVGKGGKLIRNPDKSEAGYMSIPYEITKYLTNAHAMYADDDEITDVELRHDDVFLKNWFGEIPEGLKDCTFNWSYTVECLTVTFPSGESEEFYCPNIEYGYEQETHTLADVMKAYDENL